MKIKGKYKKALEKFVEKYRTNKNVIGIILSGSFVHSKLDKNSDLDVFIVLKEGLKEERGNTWIDGIEIEYFMNPVKQVEEYFKREKNGGDSPSTAHMFVNSIVLLKKDNCLDRLIRQAKIILDKKLPRMTKNDREYLKYVIDDYQKDLEDVYIREDYFVFRLVAYKLINLCLEGFYKTKRIPARKYKGLRIYLKKFDKKFERLFSDAIIETDFSGKFRKINKLIRYVEELLGGKRTKEWKLKSNCTYLKK